MPTHNECLKTGISFETFQNQFWSLVSNVVVGFFFFLPKHHEFLKSKIEKTDVKKCKRSVLLQAIRNGISSFISQFVGVFCINLKNIRREKKRIASSDQTNSKFFNWNIGFQCLKNMICTSVPNIIWPCGFLRPIGKELKHFVKPTSRAGIVWLVFSKSQMRNVLSSPNPFWPGYNSFEEFIDVIF